MFRSRRRPVVFPQLEHARLAGAIAAAWGNDRVPRPPLPFDSVIRGVREHDRGYGELDNDPIGETPEARWLEIERRGLAALDGDPVVDLLVALHIQRLVASIDSPGRRKLARELSVQVARHLAEAGATREDAADADVVTHLCDAIAFDLCFETESSGTVGRFSYRTTAGGVAEIDPWPLGEDALSVTVTAYADRGYPERREPVPTEFTIIPRTRSA